MPCGFPTYGIPPLAPFTKDEKEFKLNESFVDTVTDFFRLRLDGLDKFDIKTLSIGLVFKKVKFHFIFRELRFRSQIDTNTFIDMMEELGFDLNYEGKGTMDLSLKHLEIKGSFKYSMPIAWGSMKIYKFKTVVTLRDCDSNITTDWMSTKQLNRKFNDVIENKILSSINDNQAEISGNIEEALVPRMNAALKGHKVWYMFSLMWEGLGNNSSTCIPSPEPWYN